MNKGADEACELAVRRKQVRRAVVVVAEFLDVGDVDIGVTVGCQANADDDVGAHLQPSKRLLKLVVLFDLRHYDLLPLCTEVTAPLNARGRFPRTGRPSVRDYYDDALRTRTLVHAVGGEREERNGGFAANDV